MGESTLRWPTDKEREEKEEVCSIGEKSMVSIQTHTSHTTHTRRCVQKVCKQNKKYACTQQTQENYASEKSRKRK